MSTTSPSLARSSAIMAAGSFVSRVLGVVRASMLVTIVALSLPGNAFNAATTLPNTIYLLVAGGVLNAVLVPQINKALHTHADGGQDFTDRLITISLLLLGIVTALCLLATPLLVAQITHFHDSAVTELTVKFALITMPAIFFYGLYAVLGQVLNARERFGPFMWAPVLCNIVWIAGLGYFLFAFGRAGHLSAQQWTPQMIWTIAGSLTIGVAVQALVLIIPLWRDGFRYRPRWGFRGVGLASSGKVAGWTFAALGVSQLGILVQTKVLTTIGGGYPGLTAYTNAFLLFMTPHGFITVSVVTALFTAMSRSAAAGDSATYRADVTRSLAITGVATLPVAIGTMVLGTALTRVIYPASNIQTTDGIAYLTVAMMIGLPGFAWLYTLQRAFYALEDARTPFLLQVISTAVAVAVALGSLLLDWQWRAVVLCSGQALSNIVCAVVAVLWMRRRVGGLDLYRTIRTQVRVLVACLPGAVVAYAVFLSAQLALPPLLGAMVALAIGGTLFLVCFASLARRMGVDDVDRVLEPVLRRVRSLRSRPHRTA